MNMYKEPNFKRLLFYVCVVTLVAIGWLYFSSGNQDNISYLNSDSNHKENTVTLTGLEYREELGDKGVVGGKTKGTSPLPEEYNTASDLLGEGKIEEAARIYKEMMKKDPYSDSPFLGLSVCYMKSGDYSSAKKFALKALEINPKSIGALINLGSSYRGLGDQKSAIESYSAALEILENPDAHWGLIRAYASIGDKKNAQIHLDHFKRLAPNSKYIPGLEQEVRSIR